MIFHRARFLFMMKPNGFCHFFVSFASSLVLLVVLCCPPLTEEEEDGLLDPAEKHGFRLWFS